MALPAQVEQAGKRADELIKEMSGNTEGTPKDVDKPNEGDPPTPENPENSQTPAPADKPEPTAPPQEETVDSLKTQLDSLQHKHNVLKGKYDKEVKAVRDEHAGQIAKLNQQIVQLSQANAQLNQSVNELQAKAAKPAEQTPANVELSDEDREYLNQQDLDEKTLRIIAKYAGGQNSGDLLNQVNAVKSEVEEVRKLTQEERVDRFWKTMRERVPDLDTINNDPAFMNWLAQPVSEHTPDTTRQMVMNQAGQTLNAQKAIQLFQAYIKETSASTQQTPPKAPDPEPNPLEKEIEPSNSAPTDPTKLTPKGRVYTTQEITRFYQDMAVSAASNYTTGPWAGKKADCEAMDADIKKAAIDGRVKQ